MTVISVNSISGITSITAQSGSLNFYDSAGRTLSIGASVSGNITGNVNATGVSTFSGGVIGNVTGNLNGSVTGNVTGNLNGNVTGSVTGNINSSGVSTVSTLTHPSKSNPILVTNTGTYIIYISDSGNDTTGNGTSGNPYRGLNKAFSMLPDIINRQDVQIIIQGASYTLPESVSANGLGGSGNVSVGQRVLIIPASGTITFNNNNYSMSFSDVSVPIVFANLNFVGGTNVNGIYMTRCKLLYMQSNCTWTSNSTYGWSYGGGAYFTETDVDWRAPVTVSSTATAGLGGLFVFYNCPNCFWSANIIKSGTKFANTAVSINNLTWFTANGCTISNFNTGIYNGVNHYGAETGGHTMLNGLTLSNCTTGIALAHGAVNTAYSVTYSGNTTNISSSNSFAT